MKRLTLVFCLSLGLLSCKEDDNLDPVAISSNELTAALTVADGLIISEFIEEGVNETDSFLDYLFVFDADGTVSATKTGHSISGTYRVFTDDGKTELMMTFPNSSELNELTDDWYFISKSDNTLKFDDRGDVLEFQQQ